MNSPRHRQSHDENAGTARAIVVAALVAGTALAAVGVWWAKRPRSSASSQTAQESGTSAEPQSDEPQGADSRPRARTTAPIAPNRAETPPNAEPVVIVAPNDEIATGLAQAAALAQTDPAEARRYLAQLAERFPRNERILSALATLLDGTDDVRAREVAQRCLEVNPSNVRCNTVVFTTFARAGDYDAGLPYVVECIRTDATDTGCLSALLDARVHRGELEEARAVSDRIHEQTDGGFAVYASAQVAEASGHGADALHGYQEACAAGIDAGCARAAMLVADGGR